MGQKYLDYETIRQLKADCGTKFIHVGGKGMPVQMEGMETVRTESGLIKVTTYGNVTQVEEGERLHAIVRLRPFQLRISGQGR